jgi:hypothetical protein
MKTLFIAVIRLKKQRGEYAQPMTPWYAIHRFAEQHPEETLLLLCLLAFVLTAGGHLSSTDEEDLYLNTALLSSRFGSFIGITTDAPIDTSEMYRTPQETGQSLVALPWYWAGQSLSRLVDSRWQVYLVRAVMTSFNLFITLITVWALYRWARDLASPRAAIVTAGLYALATFAWPYSQTFYREPLVALCLLIAFWFAARFRTSLKRPELLISVAALSLVVATKVVTIIAVPWWVVIWASAPMWSRTGFKRWLGAAVLMVLAAAALVLPAKGQIWAAYLQELRFDLQNAFSTFLNFGLRGLLISPGKGLFITAPPVLLSLLGFPFFVRRHRKEAIAIGGLFITFLLAYSTRRGWHAGACWGPRYLLPVLPLLMLPVTEVVQLTTRNIRTPSVRFWLVRGGILAVALMGFLVQLAAVSIFPLNYYQIKNFEGIIAPESMEGGPSYLQELFFDPKHSPVWGQATLALERVSHLLRYGTAAKLGVFPTEPDALGEYMTAIETLDFWWLHWLLQSPQAAPPDPRLGIELASADEQSLALSKEGGTLFYRWRLNWFDVEISDAAFGFERSDQELGAFKAAGVTPNVVLSGRPDWALVPGTRVPKGITLPIDSDQNLWARFVRASVSRYPEIKYWEIWNEPDLVENRGGSVEDYLDLLKTGYLVIKETNPDAQVVMGGLPYRPDPGFFERLLDHIVAAPEADQHNHYFDILAWRGYGRSSDSYDIILWAREVMAERDIEKPIWISQTNLSLEQKGVSPTEEPKWNVTPQEQATFIIQAYANGLAAGAEKIFLSPLSYAVPADGGGLATNEPVPLPTYIAFQAVAEFLSDATPIERQTLDGVTRVTFKRDVGQVVWVMWNETPTAKKLFMPMNTRVVRLGYPDRRTNIKEINDGVLDLVLPPATAKDDSNTVGFPIGGAPVFVFFDPLPTQNQ